ncbi:MAG: recombinase family protein [Limnohabitans sp.]|nr:MAG: recombinase family protein [Limnohabitans sp.]
MPALACAIYTRKSPGEGLEQNFNSLHAQREACEAFVLSQKSPGWTLLPTAYDDGGFSGGNVERPALQRLLAAIEAGKIKVIVVCKVDCLTRSPADFAKLVELFDAEGVSFVSVTQQFNTTTSMGRLALNVLLSFAQFEREVTGERDRAGGGESDHELGVRSEAGRGCRGVVRRARGQRCNCCGQAIGDGTGSKRPGSPWPMR